MRIAILGGTGPQARGLGSRFARADHLVRLGSRDRDRAGATAADLRARFGAELSVEGDTNRRVVRGADLVVVSVPYAAQVALLDELADILAGLTVVTCVNPLGFDRLGPHGISVPEGSAAEQAQAHLPRSAVVAAFHHLSAATLLEDGPLHDESVLVCADDQEAKATVVELAATVAARGGIDAGPLRNARWLEGLTAVLISVNQTYGHQSGIAISGL